MGNARVQWALAQGGPLSRLGSPLHAVVHKISGGRLGRRWLGAPGTALETCARTSGKPRSTTVICVRDGDGFVVIPSNAGSDRVPAWWLNLKAAGEGVVVVAGERVRVRARETSGDERERLWKLFARTYPQVDDYTRFTTREFPVVRLERAGDATGTVASPRPRTGAMRR